MVRFREFLAGRAPDEPLLQEYLRTKAEWINFESKEAKQPPVFGIRKTVSAFANTDGGDLFLGVADDGTAVGTPVDPATVSRILRQEGAPAREDHTTNLLAVVVEPVRIPLATGEPVYWIDVAPHGRLVGTLKEDGSVGLYDRPGAESPEVRGFDAIALFRRKNRARLLLALFEEFERVVRRMPSYTQGSGDVREDMLTSIRSILDSEAWREVASKDDWSLLNSSYIGCLLSYPTEYATWGTLRYQERENRIRYRKTELDTAVANFRRYLIETRILPPADVPMG